MPACVIVLPVKCSTVKRVDAILDTILFIECVILWISATGYFVVSHAASGTWAAPKDTLLGVSDFAAFIIMCVGTCIVAYYAIAFIFSLGDYISLECIKDEKEKP